MLYPMLALNKTGSWGTTPMAFLRLAWVTSRMSWPSIKIRPSPSCRS